MKIDCDNGACLKELKELQRKEMVKLYIFKYENNNRHLPNSGVPSKATWADMKNYTWANAPGAWSDYTGSDKYEQIASILGVADFQCL